MPRPLEQQDSPCRTEILACLADNDTPVGSYHLGHGGKSISGAQGGLRGRAEFREARLVEARLHPSVCSCYWCGIK